MKFNTQSFTSNLQSIHKNSRMTVQEDCYDTSEIQQHIYQRWVQEKQALLERSGWTAEQKKQFTLNHLSSVVDYAYENIPFYCEFYKAVGYEVGGIRSFADFRSLPVLNKGILRNVKTEDFMPRNLSKDAPGVFWSSTSGSSGVALPILSDLDSVSNNALNYYRMFQQLAGAEFTPDRWIYNVHHIRSWTSSMMGDYPTFTLNDIADSEEFVQHLEQLRPIILNLLPSYLPILEPYSERIAALGLKAIVTNSEASSRHEREYYSRLFRTNVLDEYSSEEVGIIALECPYRHYHPDFDQVYVELETVAGSREAKLASVYCTDFLCRTMPFIRYDHGDIVSIGGDDEFKCQCGRHGRTIERVEGRKDDCLRTIGGHYVPTAIVTNTLDSYFNANQHVESFRLIQKRDIKNFDFLYTGSNSLLVDNLVASFAVELKRILKMEVNVKAVWSDFLPATASYKRKKIICEK
ncbi:MULTISPECIES: phenylacetate--CoA ligase family protein [unclassified Pseudomonas]|uniref:phenylacetate--CoA ligase family protein n=1 Tax=unclassified Pseudomonas TaxID=196821 RepID=UPI000B1D3EB1|nr:MULTISPECIES: phenylacetate--CoA ligase family protein [unclassified Pseudomonas]